MAATFTVKQTKGSRGTGIAVARDTTTGTITLADAAAAGETVVGMTIADIVWSLAGAGTWTLTRDGNTLIVLNGSGQLNFADNQLRLETTAEELESLVYTLSGTGSIIIKFHKRSGA
jgi:hypothetical protein